MTHARLFLPLVAALLTLTVHANAHHSFAMYDSSRLLALDGKVTKFQWTNPHALLWVSGNVRELPPPSSSADAYAPSPPGKPASTPAPSAAPGPALAVSAESPNKPVASTQPAAPSAGEHLWILELPTSPGNLARMGWSKHSLKAGERVIIELSPLRDGSHGGSFKKATLLASGKTLLARPTSIGADGMPNFGPNEAKPEADKLASTATRKSWWSCSFQGSPTKLWPSPLLAGLALITSALRRRSTN